MILDTYDHRLIAALEQGLPSVPRPYREIGERVGLEETQVIERLKALREAGLISRFGIVVRHHTLGYHANAMVVWDVPDEEAAALGELLSALPHVTLCYRRRRAAPHWPYNLFCMIHGHNRDTVEAQIETLTRECGLNTFPRAVLFSHRRFKQCGARYAHTAKPENATLESAAPNRDSQRASRGQQGNVA